MTLLSTLLPQTPPQARARVVTFAGGTAKAEKSKPPRPPILWAGMVGKTFHGWTVLRHAGATKKREVIVLCRCVCGTERRIHARSIRRGKSRSCGCGQAGSCPASDRRTTNRRRGLPNPPGAVIRARAAGDRRHSMTSKGE